MIEIGNSVVLSAAKDLAVVGTVTGGAGDGWDRAAPAALIVMGRPFGPVRRWSGAVRPVMLSTIAEPPQGRSHCSGRQVWWL
jgi:hypothetical protein